MRTHLKNFTFFVLFARSFTFYLTKRGLICLKTWLENEKEVKRGRNETENALKQDTSSRGSRGPNKRSSA